MPRDAKRREGREVSAVALSSLDFLLAVDDVARVGALRFVDEAGVFQRAPEERRRTVPPLVELGALLSASRAVEANGETAADLAYLRGRGTSLGGLRPKCTVVDDDGSLSIGKFPSVADDRAVTKGEILALKLARAAGIDAARGRLVESEDQSIALIRRFDRPAGGGRSMYVSAATMIGAEEGEGGEHSYTEIVDALRMHGVRRKPTRRNSGGGLPSQSSSPTSTITSTTMASCMSTAASGAWRRPSTSIPSPSERGS